MAYKVLNNILLKDVSSSGLSSLKTDLLVLVINKETKTNASFKDLNKISKNYLSKAISSHLKESGSSVLLPNIDGINARNILLVKGLNKKDPVHKWLSMYQSVAYKGNHIGSKDISVMPGSVMPNGKDEFWLIEMVSKTIESNVYIFSETKNKTVKRPSVKKLTVQT